MSRPLTRCWGLRFVLYGPTEICPKRETCQRYRDLENEGSSVKHIPWVCKTDQFEARATPAEPAQQGAA